MCGSFSHVAAIVVIVFLGSIIPVSCYHTELFLSVFFFFFGYVRSKLWYVGSVSLHAGFSLVVVPEFQSMGSAASWYTGF